MDYKKECQNALDIFEQSFRVFVRQKMLESFGDSWWKTNVPEQIGNACRERIGKEQSQRFPIFPVSEPIYYTNIGELKDLICRKDNFEQAFKPLFGNTETISSKLTELIAFRNPAAHNRPVLGSDHYEAVIVICRSIFDAMEMVRPPLFKTMGNQIAEPAANDHETVELIEDELIKSPNCIDNLPRPDYSTFFGRDSERSEILEHLNHPRAWITIMILSQKVCVGRIRTNVPTPGCNIQSLFRILPQHTVALRCAKSLELPQNGLLRGNQ